MAADYLCNGSTLRPTLSGRTVPLGVPDTDTDTETRRMEMYYLCVRMDNVGNTLFLRLFGL
jgi:hypothetical protein